MASMSKWHDLATEILGRGGNKPAAAAMMAALIGCIEEMSMAHLNYMDDIRDSLQGIEAMMARREEQRHKLQPLTAEQAGPRDRALLDMLARKQALQAERKAQVSKENPPRATPEKKSDG